MRDLDGRRMHSRVKGKASIVKSLHSLHRRTFRFATLCASTPADHKWALAVCEALHALINGHNAVKPQDDTPLRET
jgi:hypothetical protein